MLVSGVESVEVVSLWYGDGSATSDSSASEGRRGGRISSAAGEVV